MKSYNIGDAEMQIILNAVKESIDARIILGNMLKITFEEQRKKETANAQDNV